RWSNETWAQRSSANVGQDESSSPQFGINYSGNERFTLPVGRDCVVHRASLVSSATHFRCGTLSVASSAASSTSAWRMWSQFGDILNKRLKFTGIPQVEWFG